ncbi:TetR/AcrR family transcriptional regulator [Hydrogenophaga sp. 5NK40-0174]|uniref:TetR/AcrR family transcriptional regulator n=1 Tax=Hydrogenophaga sp. 5NK40-0174 TaxID=3127649 RepID=UPI00310437E6
MSRSDGDSAHSKKNYHHGNLREALLDAGLRLLSDSPPATISLRQLAREAAVSHAAPYHYFEDKQDLIHALGVEAMRRFVQAQKDAARPDLAPAERLLAMGLAYIHYASSHPHAFSLIFDPAYCEPGNPSEDMAPLIAENEALLGQCTSDAQAAGVLPPDADGSAAAAMWAAVHGLAQLVTAGHMPVSVAEPAMRSLLRMPPAQKRGKR